METDQEDPLGVKFETLMETLTVYGGGWEKKAVNPETWVNAMVCILKEVSVSPYTQKSSTDMMALSIPPSRACHNCVRLSPTCFLLPSPV